MGNTLGSLYTCPRGLLWRRWWKLGVTVRNFFLWSNSPKFWVAPHIHGVTDCNEWKTEKCHKYGKIKTNQMMITTVRHITSGAGRTKFQTAWFLLNRAYKLSTKSCQGLHKCWVTYEMWTVLMKYCSRSRGREMKTELVGRLHDQVFMTNTSTVYRCSMRTLSSLINGTCCFAHQLHLKVMYRKFHKLHTPFCTSNSCYFSC
jgi:hypothetical protein